MIAGIKPYAEMKDSGAKWLGAVPKHWNVLRGKWLFRNRKILNSDRSETNVLSLTLRGVVNNDPDSPEGLVPKDYATYQFFAKGDLVFKLIDLENLRTSRVGLVHENGIMSSAYVRLSQAHDGLQRYFFLQYFDLYQRGVFNQLGAGVRSTLGAADLLDMPVAVPPKDEQTAIVRFLDHADRRIRRAIAAKQKLIRLLEEQKQAIIHRAVTRGLDPDVRLKPSGVEWLGDVPEHWEVVKLGHWFRCSSGSTPSRSVSGYFGGDFPWIKTGELLNSEIHEADEFITRKALEDSSLTLLPINTLLIAMYGQGKTRGRTGLLKIEATINQASLAVLPNPVRAIPKYLQLWFISQYFFLRYISDARNATQPNLNSDIIRGLKVVLPPLVEQERILEIVKADIKVMDAEVTRAKSEIGLLNEYRTRLIADVVTGKLDVRQAAARLPDSPEPELTDDEALDEDGDAPLDDAITEDAAA